jgi:hypothetical protein
MPAPAGERPFAFALQTHESQGHFVCLNPHFNNRTSPPRVHRITIAEEEVR